MSLKDYISGLTVEQVKEAGLNALEDLGFPVTSWHSGAIPRTMNALFARMFAPWTSAMAALHAAGFLDYAERGLLTLLAKQVYDVDREPATFAPGWVTLTNTGGGNYVLAARKARILNPTTKKLYTNVSAFTLGPLQTGLEVEVVALEAGSGSNAGPGGLSQLQTPLLGVTVTNAAALVGRDEESDPSVRLRCRAKLGALSPNGPKDVYDYVARTSELVDGVVVTRTRIIADSSTGDVRCILAGPSGPLSGGDVAKVQAAYNRLAGPQCIDPLAESASGVSVAVTSTVYVYNDANLDEAQVQALVLSHLTAWFATIPIGGFNAETLYRHQIQSQILRAGAAGAAEPPIFRADIAAPASDVTLNDGFDGLAGQVATLGTVTTNVVFEARP